MDTSKSWRDYFERATDSQKNYKLFIETAYGCHGSCQGCPLSVESRSSQQPKWELAKLEAALRGFAPQLLEFRSSQGLPAIENLAITVGPAENLYFAEDYLETLAVVCKGFAEDVRSENFHLAVSTSGLFSEQKAAPKLHALASRLGKHQLSFAFIVNLRQFEKTPQHYFNFADLLFLYTDLVELEINMDVDIHSVSESTLREFARFVNQYSFVQLDFAYAINEGNQTRTYLKRNEFIDFIDVLRDMTQHTDREFFSQWHTKLKPVRNQELDFMANFEECFTNIVSTHMRLNAMGEWHFAKNILGTIYYDQSLNLKPLATITSSNNNNPFAPEAIKKFKYGLLNSFNQILTEHEACEACEWKNVCVNSGFISYSHFSPKNESVCSNPAHTIFNRIGN